uniref:Ig-like domain-containing protein n=1 Tax=Periophthalmus magnuspinnatus TaxID=409849 RepID=A0A3B3ZWI5_9GOBI
MAEILSSCLIFSFLFFSAQMNGLHEKGSFLSPPVGDNIRLPCATSDDVKVGAKFYWFRQKLGMKPELISSYFKFDQKIEFHSEFRSSNRFKLDFDNDKHDLHINNVSMSDSAVYYCVRCFLHQSEFQESVTVIVKSLKATIEVHQYPHEEIEPGHSVILNCSVQTESCEGSHRVHWFKQFVESAAGVLYSHGGGNMHDGCKNKGKSPPNSCVYNLPIHNVNSKQTGTYYCAVAACGQILFGNGTQITIKDGAQTRIIFILIGALTVSSVLVMLLAFSLCRTKKKCRRFSKSGISKYLPKEEYFKFDISHVFVHCKCTL